MSIERRERNAAKRYKKELQKKYNRYLQSLLNSFIKDQEQATKLPDKEQPAAARRIFDQHDRLWREYCYKQRRVSFEPNPEQFTKMCKERRSALYRLIIILPQVWKHFVKNWGI